MVRRGWVAALTWLLARIGAGLGWLFQGLATIWTRLVNIGSVLVAAIVFGLGLWFVVLPSLSNAELPPVTTKTITTTLDPDKTTTVHTVVAEAGKTTTTDTTTTEAARTSNVDVQTPQAPSLFERYL